MNKKATAAEKRYMGRVAALGCLIHPDTPAVVHHALCYTPRNNYAVIPLCPECHVGAFSIHKTKQQFQAVHGSELELLAEVTRRLND